MIENETLEAGSNSKIRKVSADQKYSSEETFHPKLPVWLSLCASARRCSLRRKAASARLRSSMSRFIPIQYSNVPSLARKGSRRLRNQRYSPSEFRIRKVAWPAVPVLLQVASTRRVS